MSDQTTLVTGGTVAVPAVDRRGWVRAELRFTPAQIQETFRCDAIPEYPLPCPSDQALEAMTSPIWLTAPNKHRRRRH